MPAGWGKKHRTALRSWWRKRRIVLIGVALATSIMAVGWPAPGSAYYSAGVSMGLKQAQTTLPTLQSHPLPPSLAQWQATEENYFSAVASTPVGYLIWSEFPVKVYLERPPLTNAAASTQRFQQWVDAVQSAIQEWNRYFPLVAVEQPEIADIVIERSHPPRKVTVREDGLLNIPRARSAQTTYRFYLQQSILSHRMLIQIRPGQSPAATQATARHELGHALGIWGHSPSPSDALYFSQVRDSPAISPRDINTLKKIYQQPTRLGWKLKTKSLRDGEKEKGKSVPPGRGRG
ncbi:MAG: peptidase [Cyanophyceae cyanobacterium]